MWRLFSHVGAWPSSHCPVLSLSWASTADPWTGLTFSCCTENLQEQPQAVRERDLPWTRATGATMPWDTLVQVTRVAALGMEGWQAGGTSSHLSSRAGSLSYVAWPVTGAEEQPATDWRGEPLTSFGVSPNLIHGRKGFLSAWTGVAHRGPGYQNTFQKKGK